MTDLVMRTRAPRVLPAAGRVTPRRLTPVLSPEFAAAIAARWQPGRTSGSRPATMTFRMPDRSTPSWHWPAARPSRRPQALYVQLGLTLDRRSTGVVTTSVPMVVHPSGSIRTLTHRGGDVQIVSTAIGGAPAAVHPWLLSSVWHTIVSGRAGRQQRLTAFVPLPPPVLLTDARPGMPHQLHLFERRAGSRRAGAETPAPWRVELRALAQTGPSASLARNTLRTVAAGRAPVLMLRPVVNKEMRASAGSRPVLALRPTPDTVLVHAGGDRPAALSPVVVSHPWIVGWHETPRQERQVETSPGLVPRAVSGSAPGVARDDLQFPAPAMDHPKPDMSMVRTVSEAMRGMTELVKREARAASAPGPPQVDLARLTRQVYEQLERELRIERERRGL